MLKIKIMTNEPVCIINDNVISEKELIQQLNIYNQASVYEVIRVINKKAVFLREHYLRFAESCRIVGQINFPEFEILQNQIDKLIILNNTQIGNIRIDYFADRLSLRFIPHSYPDAEMYKNGVEVMTFCAERTNPNAKVVQAMLREQTAEFIRKNQIYEALLVNHNGEITEGSKSNVFFIRKGELYSAPLNSILHGITLLKVIEIANNQNIPIHFYPILKSELADFEAVFISGTSPKILPICTVDSVSFNPNEPLLRQIMATYDKMIGH